ncbi:NUDIX domain-containing protein [Micromonospora sp. D93]|uniref:NUDIX hydrolase n=1 Tax=Micromonospora sp. D93 TaxID=2824886 RepID=UPI001B399CC3|nr:NUDIX domain-containing protein [Micromonospora sp. D93]MBQ1017931.1 NUDIX domain-containing protein [Micromonospora sp. D93]
MEEFIDTFDANYKHTGQSERVAAHRRGLWHHTFHCWIVGRRRDTDFVLLQLRAESKKNYPNMLDITAAGHLEAGERPEDGVREIEEELGIEVEPRNLIRLGVKHDVMDEPNGIQNREFAHVFLLRDDRDLSGYKLQDDEVSGLVEMPIDSGLALFSGSTSSVDCPAIKLDNKVPTSFTRSVTESDLIPRVDPYYFKVFIMAGLYLEGRRHLSI